MAAALDAPGVVEMQVGNAKKPLDEMTPKDIASWLDGQGLGHLGQSFIRHKINGALHCPGPRRTRQVHTCRPRGKPVLVAVA